MIVQCSFVVLHFMLDDSVDLHSFLKLVWHPSSVKAISTISLQIRSFLIVLKQKFIHFFAAIKLV